MDHARAAGGLERGGEVGHDARHDGGIEPPLAAEALTEALALDGVHHVVEHAARVPGRMHGNDVGVSETGAGPRLGEEPASDRLVGGELGMHRLDGDPAVERSIGGEEDDPHAPAPQLTLEPVLRFQHGLERGEEIEGRSRHGPTAMKTEPRIYPGGRRGARLRKSASWMRRPQKGLPAAGKGDVSG